MNSVTIRTEGTEITISDSNVAVQRIQLGPQPVPSINQPPTSGWEKVRADGAVISATDPTTEHVAIINYDTGLMWAVESIGDEDGDSQDHAACIKACADLRLLGHDDWRLPTRAELAALVDDTRTGPAIDTNLFPRVKPNWHWTSTPYAGSSDSAWNVSFYYGGVGYFRRCYLGFALAVRRAGQ